MPRISDTAFTFLARALIGMAALLAGILGGRFLGEARLTQEPGTAAIPDTSGIVLERITDPGEFAPLDERLKALPVIAPQQAARLLERISAQSAKERIAGVPVTFTEHRLRLLMERRMSTDPLAVRLQLEEIKERNFHRLATLALYDAWALQDAAAALPSADAVTPLPLRREVCRRIVQTASRSDPEAALKLRASSGISTHEIASAVWEVWAAQNSESAAARYRSSPESLAGWLQGRALTRGWLLSAPEKAIAGLADGSLPPPDLTQRTDDFSPLLPLLSHLDSQPDITVAVQNLVKFTSGSGAPAVARWLAADHGSELPGFLQWLATQPCDAESAAVEAARALAWRDERGALQMLVNAPLGAYGSAALGGMLQGWLDAAHAEVIEFLKSSPGPAWDSSRAAALRWIAEHKPEAALETADKIGLEGQNRAAVLAAVLPDVCALAPETAEKWLDAHPDAVLPELAAQALLGAMVQRDPAHTMRWALNRKMPFPRTAIILALTAPWLAKDRSGALQWIDSLKSVEERDLAITQLVNADLGIGDPFLAKALIRQSFERALRLSVRRQRILSLRALLSHTDAMGNDISSMLGHGGLSEADRAAVTSDKDPGP